MLDKEFKYYLDNQGELLQKYNNRFIVIIGHDIVGDYDSMENAYFESGKKFSLGTFLIQKCSPGDKDYTVTYHSRVSFA
ncbi:hypothetical protein FACS189423_00770 [Bacteroidia bacterium]|nr:hypothetical protein FACS189423_00770 [Bacteroidia bacterium]